MRLTLTILMTAILGSLSVATAERVATANDSVQHLAQNEKILIVVTSHGKLGDTGQETGVYLSELTHPYHVFTEAGFKVDIASAEGGIVPIDPKSENTGDEINEKLMQREQFRSKLQEAHKLASVDWQNYAGIFFAGGHGTMWDFPNHEKMQKMTGNIYLNGGYVGAVCHGPAALVNVTLPDGTPLVKGRELTAFTNEEEKAVELHKVVPFMLQTRLEELGASFKGANNFTENVVVDGRLVTGQNPASATGAAQAMVEGIIATRKEAERKERAQMKDKDGKKGNPGNVMTLQDAKRMESSKKD